MLRSLLLLVALGLASSAAAQSSIVDTFERRSIESNGLTVSYGLFVPEDYDPNVSYPLVLAAHGAGERGTDLRNLPPHRLATSWADPANQATNPAFVFAPQVPSGLRWTTDADPDDTDYVAIQLATLEILSNLEAEFNIDPDRIYAVGLSLGGHATWDFVSRDPDRFAAAVPMSGRGFTSQADDLIDLPIWAFTGETDTVVPPSQTRRVIQAMEDLGRQVIYTDCRRSPVSAKQFNCGFISQDSLDAAIDARADLIYESRRNVGHGPWAPWFDRDGLHDWLFSYVRQDPDAVTVTSPAASSVWTGASTITWATTRDAPSETAEVWVSRNDGRDWTLAGTAPLADGALAYDASTLADSPLARVRIVVLNADGRVAGRDVSPAFRIDGPGDAAPTVRLDDEDLRFSPTVTGPTYSLTFVAADAEADPLAATIGYSTDGGASYTELATESLGSSATPQTVEVDVAALSNSAAARFRVGVSDGTSTTTVESATFTKRSARTVRANVVQSAGRGRGSVAVRVVDEAALTGHSYRIDIDGSDAFAKTFSVTDLDTGAEVLTDVPLSDGVQESPVVDGFSVIVEDAEGGEADADQTGWTTGATDLEVRVYGNKSQISILSIDLLATETTYTITMTENVAATSAARYNIPAQDLRFTVTGEDGEARSVVFDDTNDDGRPGNGDRLFIQEPDGDGDLQLAWELAFFATAATVAPATGDVFTLVPSPRLGSDDAFVFATDAAGTPNEEGAARDGFEITSYPNPFTDRLTIEYRLASPSGVRLDVFDTLGRRVATLDAGPRAGGDHVAAWSADVASGVFFVRLTATPTNGGPVVSVQRSAVRVAR